MYLIDPLLLVFLVGGVRLAYRGVRELGGQRHAKRLLIVGGGDSGAMVARELRNQRHERGIPIGFVDDDPGKRGMYINGVRVLGTRQDMPRLIGQHRVDEVWVAIPSADPGVIREVVHGLESFDTPIKILPGLDALVDGKANLGQLRPVSVEDLLARPRVGLAIDEVRELVRGRRVLVTGAGGSIGSELCRQVAALEPELLLMLDRNENGLFVVQGDIGRTLESGKAVALIGDVTDRTRLDAVFERHRPEVVFHAAAHKHVPLMEENPCEAVKNNVVGTRLVADAARAYGAERVIFISSDKAVNPSSVMGATKRVAERLVLSIGSDGDAATVFAAVRFGNVLGSSGSVVPLFTQQIRRGEPITVTHPEMRRYFMLIPEAVQLVMHAACLARGGDLFVLEMGEQIRIVDMARTLIRLAGLRPEIDVPIVFTGTRAGEKLYEELVEVGEAVEPSGREKILRIRPAPEPAGAEALVADLEAAARAGDDAMTVGLLRRIVPTFTPVAAVPEPRIGSASTRGAPSPAL